jgi:hypothetical protein
MAMFSAKPMPTNPPVATVSPSLMQATAFTALMILLRRCGIAGTEAERDAALGMASPMTEGLTDPYGSNGANLENDHICH